MNNKSDGCVYATVCNFVLEIYLLAAACKSAYWFVAHGTINFEQRVEEGHMV